MGKFDVILDLDNSMLETLAYGVPTSFVAVAQLFP